MLLRKGKKYLRFSAIVNRSAWVMYFVVIIFIIFAFYEAKHSWITSRYVSIITEDFEITNKKSPSDLLPIYPSMDSPYDDRMGYARIPDILDKVKGQFEVTPMAFWSKSLHQAVDSGLIWPSYREKEKAGLTVLDVNGEVLEESLFPQLIIEDLSINGPIPTALSFIEDKQILSASSPNMNLAVDWDKSLTALGKHSFRSLLNSIGLDLDGNIPGGSTIAVQKEKYLHSDGGKTSSPEEKVKQTLSSMARIYRDGPFTLDKRKEVITSYLNTIPLGYHRGGEVFGLLDALSRYYEFYEAPKIFKELETFYSIPNDLKDIKISDNQCLVISANKGNYYYNYYRRIALFRSSLGILVSLRRPDFYLMNRRQGAMERENLVDYYLKALKKENKINKFLIEEALLLSPEFKEIVQSGASWALLIEKLSKRDQALVALLNLPRQDEEKERIEKRNYNKSLNSVKNEILSFIPNANRYDLARMDITVQSTVDGKIIRKVDDLFERIRKGDFKEKLVGEHLLSDIKYFNNISVLFSLYKKEHGAMNKIANAVSIANGDDRAHFLDVGRMELGSTAKVRTVINLLSLLEENYKKVSLTSKDTFAVCFNYTLLNENKCYGLLKSMYYSGFKYIDEDRGEKYLSSDLRVLRSAIGMADRYRSFDSCHQLDSKMKFIDPIKAHAICFYIAKDKVCKDNKACSDSILEYAKAIVVSGLSNENFFTGGGVHRFKNFKPEYDKDYSLYDAFKHSNNLVFVRLMAAIEKNYINSHLEDPISLLRNDLDQRREALILSYMQKDSIATLKNYKGRNGFEWGDYVNVEDKGNQRRGIALWLAIEKLKKANPLIDEKISIETVAGGQDVKVYQDNEGDDIDWVDSVDETYGNKVIKHHFQHVPTYQNILSQYCRGFNEFSLSKGFELQTDINNISWQDIGSIGEIHPIVIAEVALRCLGYNGNVMERLMRGETMNVPVFSNGHASKIIFLKDSYKWLYAERNHKKRNFVVRESVERYVYSNYILKFWQKTYYPYRDMVPSLASALGSSGDTPRSLSRLMALVINEGKTIDQRSVLSWEMGVGTPYATQFNRIYKDNGEYRISKEVASSMLDFFEGVTEVGGTGGYLNPFKKKYYLNGEKLTLGVKTGTGDNNSVTVTADGSIFKTPRNRTASIVFHLSGQYYGSLSIVKNFDIDTLTQDAPKELLSIKNSGHAPIVKGWGFTSSLSTRILSLILDEIGEDIGLKKVEQKTLLDP